MTHPLPQNTVANLIKELRKMPKGATFRLFDQWLTVYNASGNIVAELIVGKYDNTILHDAFPDLR